MYDKKEYKVIHADVKGTGEECRRGECKSAEL